MAQGQRLTTKNGMHQSNDPFAPNHFSSFQSMSPLLYLILAIRSGISRNFDDPRLIWPQGASRLSLNHVVGRASCDTDDKAFETVKPSKEPSTCLSSNVNSLMSA
jgi:hypothetical protein